MIRLPSTRVSCDGTKLTTLAGTRVALPVVRTYPLWMLRIPLRGSDVRTLLARVRAVLQWPVPVRYLDPPLAQSSAHGESCTPP